MGIPKARKKMDLREHTTGSRLSIQKQMQKSYFNDIEEEEFETTPHMDVEDSIRFS